LLVHHGSGGDVGIRRIADDRRPGELGEPLHELVVNLVDDDGPRAGAALLAREAEGRFRDPLRGGFEVRTRADDGGVLAAHLREHGLRVRP